MGCQNGKLFLRGPLLRAEGRRHVLGHEPLSADIRIHRTPGTVASHESLEAGVAADAGGDFAFSPAQRLVGPLGGCPRIENLLRKR